jgi:AbrB family looped-hinge helix DNA binding protein
MQHQSTPREIITSVTKRSQITLPAEVRHALGLKPNDKVAFTVAGDHVTLHPARFTLASAFASVQPATRTEDLDEVIREAKEEKASRR